MTMTRIDNRFVSARLARLLPALTLALGVTAGGAVGLAPAEAAAAVPNVGKVAMVSMQRVLNETKQGKKARNDLESDSKRKQQKLDKKRTKLESETGKLQSLKGQELAMAQEKLQRDYMELQSMYQALQMELAEKEAKMLEKIYLNAQKVAKDLAKKHGVDLILIRDETTVLYAKDAFDLTNEVVKAYDSAN